MNQQPFIILVNHILTAKKQHTPQSPLDRGEAKNADTSALEKQIDEMVGQAQRHCPYNGLTRRRLRLWRGRGKIIH